MFSTSKPKQTTTTIRRIAERPVRIFVTWRKKERVVMFRTREKMSGSLRLEVSDPWSGRTGQELRKGWGKRDRGANARKTLKLEGYNHSQCWGSWDIRVYHSSLTVELLGRSPKDGLWWERSNGQNSPDFIYQVCRKMHWVVIVAASGRGYILSLGTYGWGGIKNNNHNNNNIIIITAAT